MQILSSLGINSTIFIQFFVFVVAYFLLSRLVLYPYLAAYQQRQRATEGNQADANQFSQKKLEIQKQFETEARQQNERLKEIFEENKQETAQKKNQILAQARQEAEALVNQTRQSVVSRIGDAQKDLQAEAPQVARVIREQLVGK